MKSIKSKLILFTLIIFTVVSIIVSCVSAFAIYSSTFTSLDATMTEAASLAATGISKQLDVFDKILSEVASNKIITDMSISETEKTSFLATKTAQYADYGCNFFYADKNAHVYGTNLDISDRDFYKSALEGKHFLSSPLIRKDTGKLSFSYAIPALDTGNNQVGIIYMMFDYEALFDVVSNATIGKTGGAYVLNHMGETIMHRDQELVLNKSNTKIEAQSDHKLDDLAELETMAANGENGFGIYSYGGVNKILAYAPIPGTDGWAFVVTAEKAEFMGGLYSGIAMSIAGCIVSAILSIFAMMLVAEKIVNPIKLCVERLKKLALGDLTSPLPIINTNDETKELANSTETIVHTVGGIISDVGGALTGLGNGDFTVISSDDTMYVGDFMRLHSSISQIITNLSNTLTQINTASYQVSAGSDQVSGGAQALSQGATEQASSVQELAATINEISNQVKQNAANADTANKQAKVVEGEIENGDEQMKNLAVAMEEIDKSSDQISKIIKTIEDIAFQTNILALNAAVEAARAGEAGKGFAVVAEEVRNLASKSSEAAKSTTELIGNSMQAVKNGTTMAESAASALDRITEHARQINSLVNQIATASSEQANSIEQVTLGIDQISSVVQTNSATAEQSAAASEELSSQATLLKQLVNKFKLKSDDNDINNNTNDSKPSNVIVNNEYNIANTKY